MPCRSTAIRPTARMMPSMRIVSGVSCSPAPKCWSGSARRFLGKCSPVHFFWGSFDLACTRFSGRPAPPRKGVISGPAYSHEVCSAGFWPGGGAVDGPAYYVYTVPQPAGIENQSIRPAAASWNPQLSEFLLMYDDVRRADSPEQYLVRVPRKHLRC